VDISTIKSTPTELFLDGKIDQDGKAKVSAASLLSAPQTFSKFKLDLSNVDITSASGYSGKFVGYAINAGTLALNLDYHIKQGQMDGDNQLLLESLTLGDTVDSPEALKLPLKLALALMKDANGDIDIDLPVQGNLNNPGVKIGGIVWKAFSNLLIKVVASPFQMLGGLFENGDVSGLDKVAFTPGTSTLASSEQQKLDKLTKALQQKPALALNVSPCYQPENDFLALQTLQFNQLYNASVGESELSAEPTNYQSAVLEKLYKATFGNDKMTQLKTESKQLLTQKIKENMERDELAVHINQHIDEQMLQRLVNQQSIDPTQLISLARQRAQSVFNYLTSNEAVDAPLSPSRVQIEKEALKRVSDTTAIACPLSLTAL
jgi:outer membrane protein OmpA-like peptidoglycan-associated protein